MVHRQKVIGRYIVDFYIAEVSIVIELDGSQHCEPQGIHSDAVRDADLRSLGINVLRYSTQMLIKDFVKYVRISCIIFQYRNSQLLHQRLLPGEKLSAKLTDVGCCFCFQK